MNTRELYNQKMEEILGSILKQYLKRDPVPKDGKLLTIGTNPNWDYDLISIEGRHVGRIITEINLTGMTITFIPE